VGTEECSGQLGYQFLSRVSRFIEAAFEIAIETGLMARPVTTFMQTGCKKVLPAPESAFGGQTNNIQRRNVAGSVSSNADVSFGRGDEGVDMVALLVRCLLNQSNCGRGHAVNLSHVEHAIRLQHPDLLFLIRLFILHVELLGEDDVCGFLTTSDPRTQLQCLPVGHPRGCSVPVGDLRVPEDWNIDAVVASPGGGVHRQDAACVAAFPRLHPGSNPALQVCDDAVGHALV
jgi:hypothetical protein